MSALTVTDLFCGAGGSSSGALSVPGVTVRMAANHWDLAIATHQANHPGTDHDCADVSQVDPRRYPRTDLLWASPSCTNHAAARGRRRHADATLDLFGELLPDAAAERSRATMWDVPRFAEHHAYRGIVVENVVEAARWIMWPAWLHAMDCLGYDRRTVWLNSMHAAALGDPAPQSRDRLYVVFWLRGENTPDLEQATRPVAWCPRCERAVRAVQVFKHPHQRWGRYRAQYVYRCPTARCHLDVEPAVLPAAHAIDWTLTGQRIGDRRRPLAPATTERIAAGLARHARTADGDGCLPLLVPAGGTWNTHAVPVDRPMRTRTTRDTDALVVPLRANGQARAAGTDPLPTFAAGGNHHMIVAPPEHGPAMVMRNNTARGDQGQMSTPVDEPLRTLTTTGHQSLIRWNRPRVDDVPATPGGPALAVVPVEDCTFRMLQPHEVGAGMAFPAGYQVFGNKSERVRQYGNAVTPPAARDLIAALSAALTGEQATG